MRKWLLYIPARLQLFVPIFLATIITIAAITLVSVRKSSKEIFRIMEKDLAMEVQTIRKMFEREHTLKLNKVTSDLKVAHELFYRHDLITRKEYDTVMVMNQISGHQHPAVLPRWEHKGNAVLYNYRFVDETRDLLDGTITIFQRADSGFVRISTNVPQNDGSRAVGTYIPNASPVIATIMKGETYFGRAYVVNDWYITAYEPIMDKDSVIGMLYVGDKEKDLEELNKVINDIRIGETGIAIAFDGKGELIMKPGSYDHQNMPGELMKSIDKAKAGQIRYDLINGKGKELISYTYFNDFDLYIAAAVDVKKEAEPLVQGIIIHYLILAFIVLLLFSLFLYFVTTEKIRSFLRQIEKSDKQLNTARDALVQSEEKFRTLFNSSSDEVFVVDFDGFILEVNQVACNSLAYKKDDLTGKHISELKSDKYRAGVGNNLEIIRKFGKATYESEHLTSDGKLIPVEMKSKLIDYEGRPVILSISRDIAERKEMEERIVKTIIETEEKERKRFAADLHDDLGPVLSTIKLYTDLLKKGEFKKTDSTETISNIDELVDMAISTAREISNNIRPNVLQDFGLSTAITEFCNYINKSRTLKISVYTEKYSIQRRGIEESVLYQVCKELINNTLKHASATNIVIDLKSFEDQIILYYKDDGIGFDVDKAVESKSGLGLYNIVNKVKTINGSCDINSRPGKGMFIAISVKLKPETE